MRALLEIVMLMVPVLIAALGVGFSLAGHGPHVMSFAEPWWLLALPLPFFALLIRARWQGKPPSFMFSRAKTLAGLRPGWSVRFVMLPDALRVAVACLIVVALARPQSTQGADKLSHEGIDIALVLDLSESMSAADLYPSRIEAAKLVLADFVDRRPHDRIGLVAFGTTASTVSPLTTDHGVLRALIERLRLGQMEGTSTAIGAGLGLALNRLDDSTAQSQVIVLLTDGAQTAPGLDPEEVARLASEWGIKIYSVLMGPYSQARADADVDPARLERIASTAGGYAYRADDIDALRGSFQDLLNKLERSTLEGEKVRPELFPWFLWPAIFLLGLDSILRNTWLRRFP